MTAVPKYLAPLASPLPKLALDRFVFTLKFCKRNPLILDSDLKLDDLLLGETSVETTAAKKLGEQLLKLGA
jgi:hypothetical protein